MTEQLRNLIELYGGLGLVPKIAAILGIALVTTAGGFAAIVWLPADHFLPRPVRDSWWRRHLFVRWTLLILKNALGVIIFVMGVLMLVTPGPGLVFMLLGLSLLDFPGKRALERRLVQRPSIMKFLNELRANFGKPAFLIDDLGTLGGSRTPRDGAPAGDPPAPHADDPE